MGLGASKPVDMPEYTVELTFTCSIQTEDIIATAEAAGKAILKIYNTDVAKWEVQTKSDNSPLTKADQEANALICSELQRLTPHIPIVSEENKQQPYATRKAYQYYWLVDPLDGTKEFLKRNGEFTVNIALVSGGAPVLGVVHVPCQSKTYWAVKDKGAWVRTPKEQKALRAAEFSLDQPGLKIVGSSSHMSAETKEFMELFKEPEFMQVGSSLKLLMVAEGSAHIYPRLAPTCEWDTAAADIVVREAGGVVLQAGKCDNKGKALEDWKKVLVLEQPVVYNKEDLLNPFFVVFGARLSSGSSSSDNNNGSGSNPDSSNPSSPAASTKQAAASTTAAAPAAGAAAAPAAAAGKAVGTAAAGAAGK